MVLSLLVELLFKNYLRDTFGIDWNLIFFPSILNSGLRCCSSETTEIVVNNKKKLKKFCKNILNDFNIYLMPIWALV